MSSRRGAAAARAQERSAHAFVEALAFSFSLEGLRPSKSVVRRVAADLSRPPALIPALTVREPFPAWRATSDWPCEKGRRLDASFSISASRAFLLLGQDPLRTMRPSALARVVHHALFAHEWRDAGFHRRADTDLGVPRSEIAHALAILNDEWLATSENTVVVRVAQLHSNFARIRPFRDGNGRTGRLLSDLMLMFEGRSNATWGAGHPSAPARYLDALRASDGGDHSALEELLR